MAALNKSETEYLHEAMGVLESVLKFGYDPVKNDFQNRAMKGALKQAHEKVKTVWTMKGYYSVNG